MKSKRLTLSVLFVVAAVANALACTNLIVGKKPPRTVLPSFLILPIPMACSASYIIILPVCTRKAR